MLSQAGPGGARALTALPTAPEFRLPSSCFRVVLLRRLRLPVPIGPRRCRCGGALDALGDHRTACPTAGVLGARGAALERAAARVCREAGARVATNVLLRDMNVDVPLADGRRIEVLAKGLPLWQGAQAAVDTTLVSPVTRAGGAQPQADRFPGNALEQAAKRKRLRTYPELAVARRCKLVVLALEVGGRFGPEAVAFLRQLARARARESLRGYARPCSVHPCTVGRACWLWRRNARWLTRSWSCRWRQQTNATARSHPSVTCSRMLVTPSQAPRAVFWLRASPPVPPPRGPRPACGRRGRRLQVAICM